MASTHILGNPIADVNLFNVRLSTKEYVLESEARQCTEFGKAQVDKILINIPNFFVDNGVLHAK
jgi:hypothetical protein